jgi:hypothetical protein
MTVCSRALLGAGRVDTNEWQDEWQDDEVGRRQGKGGPVQPDETDTIADTQMIRFAAATARCVSLGYRQPNKSNESLVVILVRYFQTSLVAMRAPSAMASNFAHMTEG